MPFEFLDQIRIIARHSHYFGETGYFIHTGNFHEVAQKETAIVMLDNGEEVIFLSEEIERA